MPFSEQEIRIEYFKSSGPGGQHKNKRFTAVRLTHVASGISVVAGEERSQLQNKINAFRRLEEKLARARKKKKPRIPTRVPAAVKEKILRYKKRQSEKKQRRRKISEDDF